MPPGVRTPCQAPDCGGLAWALVIGPTGKPLRLCPLCVVEAREIGQAFGMTIDVIPCKCAVLAAAVRAVRAGGARGVAVQGPGCAVHGWQAVRS